MIDKNHPLYDKLQTIKIFEMNFMQGTIHCDSGRTLNERTTLAKTTKDLYTSFRNLNQVLEYPKNDNDSDLSNQIYNLHNWLLQLRIMSLIVGELRDKSVEEENGILQVENIKLKEDNEKLAVELNDKNGIIETYEKTGSFK